MFVQANKSSAILCFNKNHFATLSNSYVAENNQLLNGKHTRPRKRTLISHKHTITNDMNNKLSSNNDFRISL